RKSIDCLTNSPSCEHGGSRWLQSALRVTILRYPHQPRGQRMISTAADLLRELHQLHLLEQSQCAELAGLAGDAPSLAREAVRRGWLTAWQVNRIFQGRATQLLLGSYVLLDKLGEGGMGAVFKARNWKLGRIVAVKVIRKERLETETSPRRFRREIEAAAQLSHPNIVHAHDADEVKGTHFFVMEYVDGRDLAKLVKEHGPLPLAEACEYIRQAALGLQHAFERGLVHRDIKPSNLLLTTRHSPLTTHQVKLLDMGLARFERTAEEHSSTLTQMGIVVGTPDYIAPEQARDSHHADIRADLYSLGCTLYFLLTGKVPFPGGRVTEKLLKHQPDTPTPLRQQRPDVPEGVERLVAKLMAKRPDQRCQTPAELAAALNDLLSVQATVAVAVTIADETIAAAENPFADLDVPGSDTLATGKTPPDRPARPRRGW